MKGVTYFNRQTGPFVRVDRSHSAGFHLTPVEMWLLMKYHGHQDGIFSPSMREIYAAAKAEGEPGMPNIKTLEKANTSLQDKGYLQVRRVDAPGVGRFFVRSVTWERGVFSRDLLGRKAPTDEQLATEIVEFNASQRRPDVVRSAYERRAQRERDEAGNVISLDDRRASRAG